MDKVRTTFYRLLVILLVILASLILCASCERFAPIQIENKTSEVVTIYVDKYRIGEVKPDHKIKNNLVLAGQDYYLIEAYDVQQSVVYTHRFSREEIEKLDWKVTIVTKE